MPAGNSLVTYEGPVNPREDRTTVVEVGPETFPLGQQVQTTKSTADLLAAMAGHKFTIESARPAEKE